MLTRILPIALTCIASQACDRWLGKSTRYWEFDCDQGRQSDGKNMFSAECGRPVNRAQPGERYRRAMRLGTTFPSFAYTAAESAALKTDQIKGYFGEAVGALDLLGKDDEVEMVEKARVEAVRKAINEWADGAARAVEPTGWGTWQGSRPVAGDFQLIEY